MAGQDKSAADQPSTWLKFIPFFNHLNLDYSHCTDFMSICYVPQSKTGVPNTTRSQTHNLFFILAEARCTCCLSCDTSKMQHRRCRGAHHGCTQLSLISKSIWLHPRRKMWDHLRKNQMFIHVQSILKHLYIADQYTLLDRYKSATLQPSLGVKQGCPLSPQLFSIYLNDIDSVTDGAQGALTVLLTHGFANHAKQAESLR